MRLSSHTHYTIIGMKRACRNYRRIRGCQFGTWSVDQEKVKGTLTKLRGEDKKKKKKKTKGKRNKKANVTHSKSISSRLVQ